MTAQVKNKWGIGLRVRLQGIQSKWTDSRHFIQQSFKTYVTLFQSQSEGHSLTLLQLLRLWTSIWSEYDSIDSNSTWFDLQHSKRKLAKHPALWNWHNSQNKPSYLSICLSLYLQILWSTWQLAVDSMDLFKLANCPAVFLSYFHCGFVMKYSRRW